MNSSHDYLPLESSGPVYIGGLPDFENINAQILEQYSTLCVNDQLKRTHFFMGRFENTYIPEQQIPAIQAVLDMGRFYARQILTEDVDQMKMGFWFNEMKPGHETSLHTHEEYDEKLSAVYYIQSATNSGDLIIHEKGKQLAFTPEAGRMILFAPEVPHHVEKNLSSIQRLSVALNFGH
jgi:uncharacterized RmlC-like cupin family protein